MVEYQQKLVALNWTPGDAELTAIAKKLLAMQTKAVSDPMASAPHGVFRVSKRGGMVEAVFHADTRDEAQQEANRLAEVQPDYRYTVMPATKAAEP